MTKPIPLLAEAIRNAIRECHGSLSPDAFAEAIYRNLPCGLPIDGDLQGPDATVKGCPDVGEKVQDVLPVLIDKALISDVLSFVLRNALSRSPDSRVTSHQFSSSELVDGESVGEVATPSRTETVVPAGRSVTEGGA
ncbi:hypothetical protein [Acetobacter sp.]|uniref:hypothetical protein n=1 Tax=Acetobacter sp. TaxID=440 RepID=UPI002584BEA9|nr:hypothetical protein [Acetobacter sp.]MCC6105926.1 hypothetical protein [Acetobacter sp.]